MATEIISVTGLSGWAQVYQPDTFMNATNYKINLYPENEQEWEKIKKIGIQKKRKTNSDPEKGPLGDYIQFTRPEMKIIKGKIVYFTGPVVTMDGSVVVDYVNKEAGKRVYSYSEAEKENIERRGKPILIGNGSKIKVNVAVYDTVKGKGQRLESIEIVDLIEYVKEEKDYTLPPVLEDVRTPVTLTSGAPQQDTMDDDFPF